MDEYAEYREDRHKSYTEQRRRLDDKALSITARYDQWLLTISGGALSVAQFGWRSSASSLCGYGWLI